MENTINGKEKNRALLSFIEIRRNKLFRDAKKYAEDKSLADQVEKIDDDLFVEKEKKEELDLLTELHSYLSFEKEDPANTYEFKGFEYSFTFDGTFDGTNPKRTTVYINKENALKISKKADKFENILGVRLPVELFLLKYKGTNMPGLDYEAPSPKTADKTPEQHEAELEKYYKDHGVDKEQDEVNGFRKPYPHEKIDCRGDKPTIGTVGQRGYYADTVETLAAEELEMEHGEPGLEPGEEQPIKKSVPLGQRFRALKNFFSDENVKKKFKKGLGIVGLGAGAIALLHANPMITSIVLAGAGIGVLAGKFVVPKIKKAWRKIKTKIHNWWMGTGETKEEPKEKKPTLTPEQINARIEQIQLEIFEIEGQIESLEDEISILPENDPQIVEKQNQIAELRNQIKAKQKEIPEMFHTNDQEHTTGGPRR